MVVHILMCVQSSGGKMDAVRTLRYATHAEDGAYI
jgi:hypothetical protein